jgi:hypothetical protein
MEKPSQHALKALQCSDCRYEFVIVSLNKPQNHIDDPSCPECGHSDEVHEIDCIDFKLIEHIQQYEIQGRLKPLERSS